MSGIGGRLEHFVNLVERFAHLTGRKDFFVFWKTAITRIKDKADPHSDAYKEAIQALIKNLSEVLTDRMDLEERVEEYREQILKSALVELDEAELPGKEDDPETPLGFYRALSPVRQEKGKFSVYAPCATSMFEVPLHGPSIAIPFAKNVNPSLSTSFLEGIEKMIRQLNESLKDQRLKLLQELSFDTLDPLKQDYPFLPLIKHQNFYQEARRFYGQGDWDYYKAAVTSGMVIPEDYYDRKVYETHGPGITFVEDLKPGSLSEFKIGTNEHWEELVKEAVKNDQSEENSLNVNPYRPVYFDSALERIRSKGGTFHNLIDVEITGERLRENYERWSKKGLGEKYMEDAINLLTHFLSHPKVQIYMVRSFDSAWRDSLPKGPIAEIFRKAPVAGPYISSLTSNDIVVFTSRGEWRKINNGFWTKPAVLDWLTTMEIPWTIVPYKLLGLSDEEIEHILEHERKEGKLWQKFIIDPAKSLFREENRVKKEDKDHQRLAREIIEELLRPDIEKMKGVDKYLTLKDLEKVFNTSYGRLRQWIKEFNLGNYSEQFGKRGTHRFTKENLRRFINKELSKKFTPEEINIFLKNLEKAFSDRRLDD